MATLLDTDLLTRYAELETLIQQALDAIARGDCEGAILLGYGIVGQATALTRTIEARADHPALITALERARSQLDPPLRPEAP